MFSAEDFSPVTLEDRDLFSSFYRSYPQLHSDNSFANMVCWNHYAHYRKAVTGDHLVLSSTVNGETRFRFPIGPRDPEVTKEVLRLSLDAGGSTPFVTFNGEDRSYLGEVCPELVLHPFRDFFEYVYLSSDLADLPGKPYLKIRHQLNRFHRRCSFATEAITGENTGEAREFLERWCDWRDCETDPVLAKEREAILFALAHLEVLNLSGLLIRVRDQEGATDAGRIGAQDGNRIGAMAIFQELNPETAVVHFEKGLPDCEGIYRAVNQETALLLRDRYPFINRESDLGVPGLREAKERYHPHHLVGVYYARRSEMERVI
ncbi:MAG TPA: phosphatidylglycerol lysyltransferase domain-containing protein [Methanomicrobiales archaeon]|nr:phosphatidylglycerol lysyltransferase domain-containing protein [Methanomicrobiales archaeon]